MEKRYATFAAGCFWGVQSSFDEIDGVLMTTVGYTGGHTKDPTYEQVCTDKTGHAEAVRVLYDSDRISYADLVSHFFSMHDPTTPNRQGPDVGSQYRSVIFYHDEEQKRIAEDIKDMLEKEKKFKRPIVTEIAPASEFYRAEEYHQKYFEKHGKIGCHF
jgi:methionine-S-sulfoxide reductase